MPGTINTTLPLDTSSIGVSDDRTQLDLTSKDVGTNSPPRPPVSPITPVTSTVDLVSGEVPPASNAAPQDQATFIERPDPVPFSEAENTDAMALKAAISVLQFQKEKSRRDLQTLQKLKQAAIEDPDGFTQDLFAGKLKQERDSTNPLKATFENHSDDEDDEDEDEDQEEAVRDTDGKIESDDKASKFPKFPSSQDVFRCPPVNWAKYHIVGEPLDKMHEDQRLYPTAGEPAREEPHVIAAPYNPFSTNLNDQYMQTRRTSQKPP